MLLIPTSILGSGASMIVDQDTGSRAGLCLMIDGCACILAQFLSRYLAAWIVSYFAFTINLWCRPSHAGSRSGM